MTKEELRSYRLTSMEEPTDEQLQAIMEGVRDRALLTTLHAQQELDRRFQELARRIAERHNQRKQR